MSSLKDRKAKSKGKPPVKASSPAAKTKPLGNSKSLLHKSKKPAAAQRSSSKPAVAKATSKEARPRAAVPAKTSQASYSKVTLKPESGTKNAFMSTPKNTSTTAGGSKAEARSKRSEIILPNGYKPSEGEPFMNERQRLYFRNKLLAWKDDIVRQNRETLQGLHEDSAQHADLADRATSETDRALELRARDRQRKLVSKIDAALARIEDGSYGYCEETGEPISLKRLDARPIATMSLEAQERHERRERVFRED